MWAILLTILLEVLKKYVGGWAADLFDKYLKPTDAQLAAAMEISKFKGATLDDFKLWLQSIIINAINQRVSRPVIRAIMIRLLKSLDGAILQFIWDKLVEAGIIPAIAKVTAKSDEEGDTDLAPTEPETIQFELSADEKHFLQEEGIKV